MHGQQNIKFHIGYFC